MNQTCILTAFGASVAVHLILVPFASMMIQMTPPPIAISIELVDVSPAKEPTNDEVAPLPIPKHRVQNITVPKLLSKPEIFESKASNQGGNILEEVKEPDKPVDRSPPLAVLPPDAGSVQGGWSLGNKPGEAEGGAAGAASLFGKGDVGIVRGSGVGVGGDGQGRSGLGRGTKGDGTGGGGAGPGEGLAGLARPLGGYQVKPRYPESARRAGAQGITLLKLRVLENGRVGEVLVEQSAGHRDLDNAAVEAVKKWLFEPARLGKEPVAVWVLLPVKFELN